MVGPFGLVPTEYIGKPIAQIASRSRQAPSITTATTPTAIAWCDMISPISALVRSPLPSITSTSPGRAMASAAWIIRLSPGRTSTVTAVPAKRIDDASGAMRPCSAPRRPATSARMEEANSPAWRTMSAGVRSKSRMTSGNAAA